MPAARNPAASQSPHEPPFTEIQKARSVGAQSTNLEWRLPAGFLRRHVVPAKVLRACTAPRGAVAHFDKNEATMHLMSTRDAKNFVGKVIDMGRA